MADALSTITNLIVSSPRELVAGGVLFGVVWGFFKGVESILNDDTKLEIAVWLLDRKALSPTFQGWPDTFAKVFDRVFGSRHLSWNCFWRSSVASYVMAGLVMLGDKVLYGACGCGIQLGIPGYYFAGLASATVFDYLALLTTRICLAAMNRAVRWWVWFGLLLADAYLTVILGLMSTITVMAMTNGLETGMRELIENMKLLTLIGHPRAMGLLLEGLGRSRIHFLFFPTLLTSIWLWLYAGSGFVLKFARRFDIGFRWFNRRFDIEKKPLQSIGLVAGALVAVVYWAAVIVSRILT